MKNFLAKSILLAAIVALTACSSTPVRRSVKETWNDTRTATKIRYKLMKDSDVKKSHMHVEVFRSQVTLTGRAMTDAEKARAETVAKSVKRVTGVENYVHVVGGDATKALPAVAKVQEIDKIKITTPTGKEVIEEKTLKEVPLASVAPAAPKASMVPTIRESTGERQAAPVTARKVVEPKATKPVAAKQADTKLATVHKAEPAAKPVVTTPAVSPAATASQVGMSVAPSTKVVGQSKTGLPWDGEVYDDDASRITPVSKAPAASTPVTAASRNPVKVQSVTPPAPVAPVTTGDDLAKEAAAELEKLRQKK